MRRYIVGVNDIGRRVGEDHHRSRLSDQAVDQIRQLRDRGESFGRLARKFGVGKSTVRDICTCRIRAQLMVRVKPTKEPPPVLAVDALDLPPMAEIYAPDDWPAPRPGLTVAELALPPLNNTEESGQRAMRLVCWAVLKDPQ